MLNACVTPWRRRLAEEPCGAKTVGAIMDNKPQQPAPIPEGGASPDGGPHTENGIPPEMHGEQPKGTPTSDRNAVEKTPSGS